MVRSLETSDFRAVRRTLEPDDYALNDGEPDPPPNDLISKDTWAGIMDLPDSVAIYTTGFQGSRIELLNELWSGMGICDPTRWNCQRRDARLR
jgi:hypothetical protein